MNIKDFSLLAILGVAAVSTACTVDDDAGGDTDTDTNPTTMTNTDPTNMTDPSDGTTSTTNSTDPDSTASETEDPTGDTETGDTDTDTDTTGPDPDAFDIREDDPSAYTQVERVGFPGVNTALIGAKNKDAYNAASPENDVAGDFASDVIASLNYIHDGAGDGNGLEDDVEGAVAALFPKAGDPAALMCQQPSTGLGNNTCVSQGGPFIFPDVLVVDTNNTSFGFPLNGRGLEDPVIDMVLAVLLLDVLNEDKSPNLVTLNAFADLDLEAEGSQGLSQSGNDLEFSGSFPYLAPAHE